MNIIETKSMITHRTRWFSKYMKSMCLIVSIFHCPPNCLSVREFSTKFFNKIDDTLFESSNKFTLFIPTITWQWLRSNDCLTLSSSCSARNEYYWRLMLWLLPILFDSTEEITTCILYQIECKSL